MIALGEMTYTIGRRSLTLVDRCHVEVWRKIAYRGTELVQSTPSLEVKLKQRLGDTYLWGCVTSVVTAGMIECIDMIYLIMTLRTKRIRWWIF